LRRQKYTLILCKFSCIDFDDIYYLEKDNSHRGNEKIISCAIEVHSSLGPGLMENLYEEAMEHELKSRGIEYKRQIKLIDYSVYSVVIFYTNLNLFGRDK